MNLKKVTTGYRGNITAKHELKIICAQGALYQVVIPENENNSGKLLEI